MTRGYELSDDVNQRPIVDVSVDLTYDHEAEVGRIMATRSL